MARRKCDPARAEILQKLRILRDFTEQTAGFLVDPIGVQNEHEHKNDHEEKREISPNKTGRLVL